MRRSSQSLQSATSQGAKVGRRKWTIFEVEKLVEAMREMVDSGVYKADNGFKLGYLHFLEERMSTSCPNSGLKSKPHIESRFKTLKKDWTVFHDILTGACHGCSGFVYDNENNTIVASDDVWADYIKNLPEVEKWHGKRFYYYDEYSGVPNTMNIAHSSGSRRARSKKPEMSSKGSKRQSGDSRTNIRDYMLKVAEIMAVEIRKSTVEIAKTILVDKERREAVVAALEEVYSVPNIERAIYAIKLMKRNKLLVGFLSLEAPYRLTWLQRMFPDVK
ncbi:hypothetical protein Syun_008863 [Stephania yunnanensis]|uniref:Myb/SANT-like domain-containing protein n=1 Tax=Stephania yunnanensis TaxID=152371 RepID=A0AAP0KFI3_9MAGN